MLIVSDASPLIALSDAKHLELVHDAFGEIAIPQEVFDEVFSSHRGRVKPSWIKVVSIADPAALAMFVELRSILDRGEAAAIALAKTLNATVLIDEIAGTAACEARGISNMTTALVVVHLAKAGSLRGKRLKHVIDNLRMHGVYVSAKDCL